MNLFKRARIVVTGSEGLEDNAAKVGGANSQSLLDKSDSLGFKLIKKYTDLFDEWNFIQEIKAKL